MNKDRRSSLRVKTRPTEKSTHFISLTIKDDARPLGVTEENSTVLNERGKALSLCWKELGLVHPCLEPGLVLVADRHVQAILTINPSEPTSTQAPLPFAPMPTLSEAVRLFKVLSSLRLAQIDRVTNGGKIGQGVRVTKAGKAPPALWKKIYSERVIVTAEDLAEARKALSLKSR